MSLRVFALWFRLLRVLLAAALLALLPLAEVAHAMPDASAVPHASTMAMPCDPGHHGDSGACRTLCLGWVQATSVTRPEAPIRLLIATLPAPPLTLTAGLGPSPRGRPPKTLRA